MDAVVRHTVAIVLPAFSPVVSGQRLVGGKRHSLEYRGAGNVEGKLRSKGSFHVRCATGERSRSNSTTTSLLNGEAQDYYDVLGVSSAASPADIRKAYRMLQKKHHPDVAGAEGHRITLLLNEAYATLMDDSLRGAYNEAHSHKAAVRAAGHNAFSGSPFSQWVGPDRPQGLFVDENVCIGCRECTYAASKTFVMDDSEGTARVCKQWADPEPFIKVAIEVCPVNCIHYVEREDLSILEYLIRPQQKSSNGVYGGGWERPKNVFMAARTFKRQMEDKKMRSAGPASVETPAQKKARMEADLKMKAGAFWRLWSWSLRPMSWQQETSGRGLGGSEGKPLEWPWKGLFGHSSTSELLTFPVSAAEVPKVVSLVQNWATTFASSSELPLPMPFRTDPLPNGVKLTLVTADNGMLFPIGALVATVEQIHEGATNAEKAALGEPFVITNEEIDAKFMFVVTREGTTGTRPLPGEGRILKLMKDALSGQDVSYSAYNIPRS